MFNLTGIKERNMTLDELNDFSTAEANHTFMQCCTSKAWVNKMVKERPFITLKAVSDIADSAWKDLTEADYLQAFDGHPKIGDINCLRAKYANTKALASGEQSAVQQASEKVLNELSVGNDEYQVKFGFIFIVCATGKSAAQMVALLHARLPNDRNTEIANAAEEQRKIFQLRLVKCLGS